jgi:precorrin-2 methylase
MAADVVGSTIVVGIVAGVSSLLGAAIGAAVSLRTNSRNIKIENITKERAKWRDNVRKKALEVHQAAVEKNATRLQELYLEFTLILNPQDPEDRSILDLIQQLRSNSAESKLTELGERIALLLKHDWQRAKWEASPWWHLWHKGRTTYAKFKVKFPNPPAVTIPPKAVE